MKRLLTVLGLAIIPALVRADYANTWSCDFGDNYASQVARFVSNASVANAILKTSNSVRSDGEIFSQTTGTSGTKQDEKYLFVNKTNGGVCALVSPPTEVMTAQAWQLQFDYMPMRAYSDSGDNDINGLSVLDANGNPLFTSMNKNSDATIYKGDSSNDTIGTITGSDIILYTGPRTTGKWFRVELTGDENGVRLTITKLDGNTTIVNNASLKETYVALGMIMLKTGNHGSSRAAFAGIDDIVCGYTLSASPGITEWTSDAVMSSIKFGAALTTEGAVNITGSSVAVPIVLSATDAAYGLEMTGTGNMSIGDTSSKGSDEFLVVESGSYTVNKSLEVGKQSYTSQNDWSQDCITMNGGSFSIAENMVYPHGIMNIWGGEWSVGKTLNLANQRRADATIHVYGGVLSAQTINVAPYAGNAPKLYLHGGRLETGCFSREHSSYTSNLYFEGGTLKALESDATFAPAGIKFTVNAAGGTLDTNGKAVSVADAIGGTGTLTVTGGGTLTLEAVPGAALNIVDSTVVVAYGTTFTAAVATSGTGTIAVDCTGHQIGDTILTSAVSLAGVSLTITGLANVQANLAEGGQGFVIAEKEEEPVVQEIVPMFITGGQSNTDGRLGADTLPEYLASNERALVSYHAPLAVGRLGQFAAYAPCSSGEGQPGNWAYDAELYYHIGNALGKTFYVAKTSYGGTSIRPNVSNSPSTHPNNWLSGYGAGFHWSADETFLDATVSAGRTFEKDSITYDGQSLLKAWIENIDAAIDALVADNKTPDVKAIIWHQGESDKNNGLYAEDLTAVVTYVREHLATKLNDEKYLTLPFFCGNIPRKSSLFTVNLDRNFATIEETADNNMHVVDIYDLTMKSDNKHFDAASAVVFGKRLFNRMIDKGVIEAEKVEVADCVREPDFGTEQVINNTTTWTWGDKSGDIATSLTNIDGIYFHAASGSSRKVQIYDTQDDKTLNWTIGDNTATVVSKGAYCTAYENNSSAISTTSTAGENNKANYMVAMNAGRSGEFEVFYWAREACTAKLYLNGTEVDSEDASAGEVVRLNGTNTVKSVYYLALGKGAIMGARFVPDEEMPAVTLTIGEDGWGTFGNLYEASFALPEGVTAYAINALDGQPTLLSMTEVGAINLGDAVVVHGAPGSYTLTSAEGAKYDAENLMVAQKAMGVLEATSGSDFINFLQTSENGELTFTKSDGTQTLAAGKAFFSITEGDAHSEQQTLNCRNTGDTTKFTWTGKGTDTLWTTLENWAWPDGKAPLNAPGAGATVSFDEAAEVTFGANTSSGIKIVIDADVSFASDDGTTERIVIPSSITGSGKLTLKNKIRLQTVTYGSISVDCTVEIEDGASATLYTYGKNAKITINGALTGGGSLTAQNRNAYGSIVLSGDMSGYTGLLTTAPGDGTITVSGDTGGSGIAIKADDAEAAAAKVGPTRPADAKSAVTEEAYAAYYTKTSVAKEGADGYFVVTVALDETAVAADETLATVNSNDIINPERDTLTLTNAKPGLYYSIVGGTDVNALNIEGEKALATSTSVSPAKPDFDDDESNMHFFRVRVSSR